MTEEFDCEEAMYQLEKSLLQLKGESTEELEKRPRGEPPYCSFCGKAKNQVLAMVSGPAVYICNECVERSSAIIKGGGQ